MMVGVGWVRWPSSLRAVVGFELNELNSPARTTSQPQLHSPHLSIMFNKIALLLLGLVASFAIFSQQTEAAKSPTITHK